MGGHDEHDPDRAAIMARRRRFIAVALGGLATGCAPGKPGPTPTSLSDSASEGDGDGDGDGDPSGGESGSDDESESASPTACLKFDLPAKLDLPAGTESGTDDSGTTGPQPCLAPPGVG